VAQIQNDTMMARSLIRLWQARVEVSGVLAAIPRIE
jgi:hypothetical protein